VQRHHLGLDTWHQVAAWLDRGRVTTKRTHAVLIATTVGMLVAVAGLVYVTGGTQGPYLHMAYVPILLAAVTGGARATFLTGLLATVLLGPLMPLDVQEGVPQVVGGWLFRGVFFVMIGLFVAAATRALRERSDHAHKLSEDLAGTYSRNLRVFADLVENRDEQTFGHCDRVGHNAVAIGRRLGLDVHALGPLYWSALLHDLGKIGVPEAILRKPGPLTADEFEEVKKHCRLGHTVLLRASKDFSQIADGLLRHHERWDGTGYPDGLAGEEIPLFGRIVAVADVFEALTSHRPYRDPLPTEEALAILRRDRGTHFDPAVVDAFMTAYRAGQIELEGAPSVDAHEFIDAVLHPERIGQALIAERASWRTRVIN